MKSIDVFLGKKVKVLRNKLNLPLKTVALELDISLQQLQRYEQGLNRIPASLLLKLSQSFSIPIEYFFEGWHEENEKDEEAGKDFQILVIEDDEGDEFLLRKALEDFPQKLNVFTIHNGEKALQFFRGLPDNNTMGLPKPDIIFLDLNLPMFQGIDLLKDIKRRPFLQNIPVIVLTNSIDSEDMKKAYQLQASGFIRKSFLFDEFKDHLHQALNYWTKTVILPNFSADIKAS